MKLMLEVIRASLDDSETIAQCARNAYSDEIRKFANKNVDSEHPTADAVRFHIKHHVYYKIMLDNNIIGGVFIVEADAQTVSIEEFCIDPLHQNKGYGKFVLTELERIHNQTKKWLLTTPVYSVRNQHLYEKHGYERVKVDDYGGTLCVYYEKSIVLQGAASGETTKYNFKSGTNFYTG